MNAEKGTPGWLTMRHLMLFAREHVEEYFVELDDDDVAAFAYFEISIDPTNVKAKPSGAV